MPEDEDTFVEQVQRPEDSRYYQVHEGVPEQELKASPPSPMPAELRSLEAHHLIRDAREEDVQP